MMSLDEIAPIQFLSQDVKNQLRSGIATPSVVQCVEELVVNSIDAGASCIAVRVDLPDCKVQVVDNGRGITKEDMLHVGERYATSKCHDTKDLENISHYGYRGEALASIKEISSVLEISSRARGSEVTYSKLYRHGKDQGISKHSKVRPSGGTTVAAHNVFYNLPVRRKVLCSPLVYEQICKRLQAISLIHPQISLTLRNDSTGVKSIQTHNSSSIVQTFGYLFGMDVADCLKEVNHIRTIFNVSGFIGSTSYRNKSLQFVYVNGRLVLKTKIHKLMSELLSNSLVTKSKGKNQDTVLGYSMKPNPTTCQPSPGGNQVEYGIFVLNITCPRSEYDITLDPSKTLVEFRDWEGALTCVHELVTSFLHREHLTMKLTVTQRGSEAGLQEKDSLSSDNVESKETDVFVNAISTTDCTNVVQSTCVRRQTIPEPDVSPMVDDQNPCDVDTIADSNGEGDGACTDVSLNHHDKTTDAFGDASERMDEPEITQSDASETTKPQCELNTHADMEKILPSCASYHTHPVIDAHCQPCGGILAARSLLTTPDNKKKAGDSPLKMQSVTADVLSCNGGENTTINEALLTSSSSELDLGSSEETLTSSEVEIGTPKSDLHQCCDARCMSLRRDDTDLGLKDVDLLSPRTKLAVKARNSLSMFRRSVKKKRLTRAAKDESSNKSGQKVSKPLQFVTANEHKTIALRWHRSPGFRSRLESLNIKCQDRQEQRKNPITNVLHRLSSSCGPNQSNNDMDASSSPSGSSRKEVCQNLQHTSTDENSKPDNHQKGLHVAEILGNDVADQHFGDKHNVSTVSVDEKEVNPAEHKEHPVQDSEGQIKIDAARDGSTEVTIGEQYVREGINGNAPGIPRSSILESTHTKERVADYPNCLINAKEQKKVVPCANSTLQSSTLNFSASAEMPRKFLTSTSFMVSACEVFDREPSQTSSQTDGCTTINNAELEQTINQSAREADGVMTQPNQQRPVAVPPCNETEPFSVHIDYEFAEGAEDLCRNATEDETLDDGTSCPLMEGDETLIEALGIQLMNEGDTVVDDDQSDMKSLLLDGNKNELKESIVDLTTEPDTVSENMDLLDTIDADESISLLYIPHQDEGLCHITKSFQESISLSKQPGEERVSSTDIQCIEMSTAPVVSSPSPSVTHQNNDELGVTGDLAVTSTQDKHCVGDDEVEISSHNNQSSQSSKVCKSFHTTENEIMDASISSAGNTDGEFVIESREWYSVYDVSRGMKVFINRFNGNCSMEKPEECPGMNQEARQISEDPQFSMVTKSDTLAHPHLPHSAAPFVTSLRDRKESSSHYSDPPVTHATMATIDAAMEESQEEDDELSMVKWGNSSHISGKTCATDEAPHFSKSDQAEMGCRFLTSNISEGLSSVDAKFQAKVLASLNPCQFSKAMFSSIKVLSQVDTKFIACLVNSDYEKNPAGEPNLLILVDQHAAHERIRLEMLTQDAYTTCVDTDGIDNDKTRCIRTSEVTPALPISLSLSELRLLEAYSHKMKRIGIEYTLSEDSVMVTHLPACVVMKEATELKRGRQTIATSMAETLIKEVLDSLQHQSGAVSSLPKTITRILNSQACHGAIKFGDTLDLDECKTLIGQLSSCDLPFQCAHGRPALMPILDFKKIKHGNSEKVTPSLPQVWKLKYLSSGTTIQG